MPPLSRCIFVSIPFILTIGTLIGLSLTWSGNVGKNDVAQNFWFFGIDTSAAHFATTNTTITSHPLAGWYTVGPWNYCADNSISTAPTFCSAPKFGYLFNPVTEFGIPDNLLADLPQKYLNSLQSLQHLARWTAWAYLIAIISAALTLPISIWAFHRRLGSLLAAFITAITAAFAIGASTGATVMYATLFAVVKEGWGKEYNMHPVLNSHAVGATWYATLSSIIAFVFWLFTACCCKGRLGGKDESKHGVRRGPYKRVGEHQGLMEMGAMGYNSGYGKQKHIGGQRFEPYRS